MTSPADALRESELQFRQIAENIREVLWLADPVTGDVLYVSPRYEEVWGEPREALFRDRYAWLHAVHPEDRARVEAAVPLQVHGGYDVEYRIIRPDGEIRWIRDRAFRVLNQESKVYRIAGIARDVTDAKRAELELENREEALRKSELRFRSLIENASELITIISKDGTVLYQSPALFRMLGYTPEERIGRSTWEVIHPDDAHFVRNGIQSIMGDDGDTVTLRARYRHRNGTYRLLEGTGSNLLHDPGVRGIVVNSRDITDQVELETQLRHAQKMEAIGRLAGGIAHDFNNLLTVISGHADLMLDAVQYNPALYEDVEQIRAAALRAGALTRQLLAFSRKQMLQPALVSADDIVKGLQKMLQRLIGENIDLRLELNARDPMIFADRGQIEQVITNMVVNARDAMPNGGRITIATENVMRLAPDTPDHALRRYLCMSLSDTGAGISEDVLPHIFEPFFTTKPVGRGTGLGLSTVYGIIEQSGGFIEVSSAVDAGTSFSVFLPQQTDGDS